MRWVNRHLRQHNWRSFFFRDLRSPRVSLSNEEYGVFMYAMFIVEGPIEDDRTERGDRRNPLEEVLTWVNLQRATADDREVCYCYENM